MNDAKIKRTYTREELHELVWATPIQKLAAEFGLSDRGLAKTCARHLVPVPPRGHWARIEAGQSVKRTPLRAVENKDLHTVHIGATKMGFLSESVLVAVAASKSALIAAKAERRKSAPLGSARSALEEPGDNPHKWISAAVKQLRKAKPDDDGVVKAPGIIVHERSRERAILILHNLARTCEERGSELSTDERGQLIFKADIGSGSIALIEERRRFKHIPTAEERVEHGKILAKQQREQARGMWSFGRTEPWPENDIVYTGKFTLTCDNGSGDGLRKSWSDGKSQSVENMLDAFLDGIKLIISAEAERRRIYAEKERQRQALQHRRHLAEQRVDREKNRLTYLDWIAQTRREVDSLRATINAVPMNAHLPPDYQRMIQWAGSRLSELEEQTTVERIQATLVERELYADPDPLFDPEGEPPPKVNYWDY